MPFDRREAEVDAEQIRARVEQEVTALGGDLQAVGPVVDDLDSRYREPHRAYHTWSHISHVVRLVDWISTRIIVETPEVILAAVFHDAVYDPTDHDGRNEERSAELALTSCALMALTDEVADRVANLVRDTASHRADERQGQVLCDADLAILASDRTTYDVYRRAVRVEYAHLDDATWAAGRAEVLRGLLARDPLYVTAPMRDRGEAIARSNLTRELLSLQP